MNHTVTALQFLIATALFAVPESALSQGIYSNDIFGYEIHYDSSMYKLHVDSRRPLVFTNVRSHNHFEVHSITISNKSTARYSMPTNATSMDSLYVVALDEARAQCDADGDYGSVYCRDVVNLTNFKTKGGLPVLKFNLVYVNPVQPKQAIGPFYFIDISNVGSAKALLLFYEIGLRASRAEEKRLDKMVQSLSKITVKSRD